MLTDAVDVVLQGIFRQLDPNSFPDRDALKSCIYVSKLFYELAAERIWSVHDLSTTSQDLAHEPLLKHLVDLDASKLDDAKSGSLEWRMAICLRSIRRLSCSTSSANSDSVDIPPEKLLPCLRKLDSVAVVGATRSWAKALAERFKDPKQRPRHMTITTSEETIALRKYLDGSIPDLELFADDAHIKNPCDGWGQYADSDADSEDDSSRYAKLLDDVGDRSTGLKVLAMQCYNGYIQGDELMAMLRCISGNWDTLQSLTIGPVLYSGEIEDLDVEITSAENPRLPKLRRLVIEESDHCDLLLQLLLLCHTTLAILETKIGSELASELDLSMLTNLNALQLECTGGAYNIPAGLASLTKLVNLYLRASDWTAKELSRVMKAINSMEALETLYLYVESKKKKLDVDLPLRLKNLRSLDLVWEMADQSNSRLLVTDAEEIKQSGFPHLQHLFIGLRNIGLRCDGHPDNSFIPILQSAIADADKTPSLYYVSLCFPIYDASRTMTRAEVFSMSRGGRRRFEGTELAKLMAFKDTY
ncbi:hypothetical protein HK101_008697 [Irineochytrium annulatum]|nr:hypothetical protein HK101_008697 [Irineochytrium annulatum]